MHIVCGRDKQFFGVPRLPKHIQDGGGGVWLTLAKWFATVTSPENVQSITANLQHKMYAQLKTNKSLSNMVAGGGGGAGPGPCMRPPPPQPPSPRFDR